MQKGEYMPNKEISRASAINFSDISDHPAEAILALIEITKRQEEQIAHLAENQEIQAGIIAKLKSQISHDPSPSQQDRGEVLRALLVANGGKMLAKDVRQRMGLDKATFSRLLASVRGEIESRPVQIDKRKMLLTLK